MKEPSAKNFIYKIVDQESNSTIEVSVTGRAEPTAELLDRVVLKIKEQLAKETEDEGKFSKMDPERASQKDYEAMMAWKEKHPTRRRT